MKPLELNKEEFFESEFGKELDECIQKIDRACEEMGNPSRPYQSREASREFCMVQWKIFRLALKEFYGKEYKFISANHYYGICTIDGSEWLIKYERKSVLASAPEFFGSSAEASFCRSIAQQITLSRREYKNRPAKFKWQMELLRKRCEERCVSEINMNLLFEEVI